LSTERQNGMKPSRILWARLVGLAVFADRLVVDRIDRALDLLQHAQHELVAGRLDVGDGGHCLGPVWRRRRHLTAFLVVLFDLRDPIQAACAAGSDSLAGPGDDRAKALELALDALTNLARPCARSTALLRLLISTAAADSQREATRSGPPSMWPSERSNSSGVGRRRRRDQ